jgi:hypothetical protein
MTISLVVDLATDVFFIGNIAAVLPQLGIIILVVIAVIAVVRKCPGFRRK